MQINGKLTETEF